MAVMKCKMCGGDLEIAEGSNIAVCEYCGTKQTVPTLDNERKTSLFGRAGRLLRACEFDKASVVFGDIVSEFPEEAEAYWGLLLCKYGVEYVDDPATGKKIPTCHRLSFESVMEDSDFEQACENADSSVRSVYREEAKFLEELRRNVIEVSSKEEPYDVFICYKETDANGDRTIDSVMAQDIYDELTGKGLKVFFARITLEDKLGMEYEPYIFAALNSAKVMLAIGTDYEYFNAVWVKNEWSRFLKLIANGEKKVLIPCYKNIDAYDMPDEFKNLQAQDMGKLGFMQDLVRGVCKIIGEKKTVIKETVITTEKTNISPLLKRAFMFLEDGDFQSADEYCEKVLDNDPECAEAYLGKLMVELKVQKREQLRDIKKSFDKNSNYQKAVKFGDKILKDELEKYVSEIEARNNKEKKPKKKNKKVFFAVAILAVLSVFTVAFNSLFSFGYTLEHGGEILAYVESEEIYNEAKNIAAGKICECEYSFEEEFEIKKELLYQKTFSNENEISDLLLENTESIYSAEGFYVDREFIGSTDSKDKWEDILEEYKESYRRKGDDSELSFEEKVEFKEGFYENSTFISTQNFETLLDKGKGENLYHTVTEGESLSIIAENYDLYISELKAMNPELFENPDITAGQKLLVGEYPYLTVVSPLSDEDYEYLLIYNEAKAIEIKDNTTKKQVKELCDKLPEDYPGKAELLAAVEEYEKKNSNSGGSSGGYLSYIQGTWFDSSYKIVITENTFAYYDPFGRVVVEEDGTLVQGTVVFSESYSFSSGNSYDYIIKWGKSYGRLSWQDYEPKEISIKEDYTYGNGHINGHYYKK